jgi:hypothetical protein
MSSWRQKYNVVFGIPLLFLSGCFYAANEVEVAEAVSPDQSKIAFVVEANGGAATSFGYVVRIKSEALEPVQPIEVAHLYGAVRSGCAYGVDVNWVSNDHLSITYLSARKIIESVESVAVGDEVVRVSLIDGMINNAAPCGGMEYNLKKS